MSQKAKSSLLKRFIISPMYQFVKDSRSVGILLIVCTIVSLLITNFSSGTAYLDFWSAPIHDPAEGIAVPHTLELFINDALMAVFFLLVGMEIKREMVEGELKSAKQSALPIFAALGGMMVPAIIYFSLNNHTEFAHGWGIPMATDIAFSLGILSLLGNRVPLPLKILLTALAIIDDLGAIVAIAIFYTSDLHLNFLGIALGLFALLILMNRLKVKTFLPYLIVGLGVWYCMFNSGVHATISGVLLAFALPMNVIPKVEKALHYPVNFLILPLFALANTAILIPENAMDAFMDTITYGVVMGLVIGKPIGITLFCFIVVKLGLAQLPKGLKWIHIFGMGTIAGIGFTMSIFISMLAFSDEQAITTAKIAVLVASLISAFIGFFFLKNLFKARPEHDAPLLKTVAE